MLYVVSGSTLIATSLVPAPAVMETFAVPLIILKLPVAVLLSES